MFLHSQPTQSTKFVIVESSKRIGFKGYQEQLRAKLLWPSFFDWDPVNYEELHNYLGERFRALVAEQGLDYFSAGDKRSLLGIITMSLFLQPSEWRKEALRDRDSIGAERTETMLLALIANLRWDDLMDSDSIPSGSSEYRELKQAVTNTIARIMNQDFEDVTELIAWLEREGSPLVDPAYRTVLTLQQKTAERVREVHGIDAKEYPHLEIEYRLAYDYLTMYSSWDGQQLESRTTVGALQTKDHRRCYTSGGYIWVEWYMVLSKLKLHPKIRSDKYYQRLRYLVVKLDYLTNDIVSFEKEAGEESPDNIIAHFVAQGHDLASAMELAVGVFNDVVEELCCLKDYLDRGQHPCPTDRVPEVSAQLEREYKEAIRLTFVLAESHFQGQITCNRYTNTRRFE